MVRIVLVGLGGGIGSIARYCITSWAQTLLGTTFPWGTAVVNIGGCFLIGFLITFGMELSSWSEETRLLLITGFLGGLTTFSTFGYETTHAFLERSIALAVGNIALNLVAGLLAVALGMAVARML